NNDFGQPGRRTATIDYSIDAAAAAASFRRVTIDSRSPGPNGQDAPSIRPAVHPDGTVYGGFLHQIGRTPDAWRFPIYDVVVVRDDNFGQGATQFAAILDA